MCVSGTMSGVEMEMDNNEGMTTTTYKRKCEVMEETNDETLDEAVILTPQLMSSEEISIHRLTHIEKALKYYISNLKDKTAFDGLQDLKAMEILHTQVLEQWKSYVKEHKNMQNIIEEIVRRTASNFSLVPDAPLRRLVGPTIAEEINLELSVSMPNIEIKYEEDIRKFTLFNKETNECVGSWLFDFRSVRQQ